MIQTPQEPDTAMNQFRSACPPWRSTALKVSLVYVVAAGLWIAFSDIVLEGLSDSAEQLSRLQTAKGWVFVLLTGILLFAYLNRCMRRQYDTFNELTTMFDSIPAIVYVADMQSFELLFVNRLARERFGSDWRGQKCFAYLQQGQHQVCSFCTNPQLEAGGQPVSWEFRNTRDGRWYQCLDKAVRWPDGRLVRLEIALDITERKEMERTKEELLAAVSHDLRTPLTAITGFAELLLEDASLSDPVRRHVGTISLEAEKLQELVQTFLEVRRLKTDRTRLGYETLEIGALLEKAADGNKECSGRHRVVIDCPADLTVFGNRLELSQVFRQLLSNSCRFSPKGGDITLHARAAGEQVEITITDQGIGIPVAERERIFEPFHRLDIGDRRRVRGIGLGLAMVREIVTLHGGSIRVEGAEGEGSRFVVSLPTHAPAPLPEMQGARS